MRTLYAELALSLVFISLAAAFGNEGVRFDLPSSVPMRPVDDQPDLLICDLRLSSMIASPELQKVDQWVVTCKPRGSAIRIQDFTPRTQTSSGIDGPIQVKITDENTKSIGGTLNGECTQVVRGTLGADIGSKRIHAEQFNRIAPESTLIASGTIDRGQGVYFKLRCSAQQVLDGEKQFQLVFSVPDAWRSGLIDVHVIAETHQSRFGGLEKSTKTLGESDFVIAVFREGDLLAQQSSHRMASSEKRLRTIQDSNSVDKPVTLPSAIRYFAAKLDLDQVATKAGSSWIEDLISGRIDPYTDPVISRLTIESRVAAMDYHDARNQFLRLGNSQ